MISRDAFLVAVHRHPCDTPASVWDVSLSAGQGQLNDRISCPIHAYSCFSRGVGNQLRPGYICCRGNPLEDGAPYWTLNAMYRYFRLSGIQLAVVPVAMRMPSGFDTTAPASWFHVGSTAQCALAALQVRLADGAQLA
jgi:hypothetical protein